MQFFGFAAMLCREMRALHHDRHAEPTTRRDFLARIAGAVAAASLAGCAHPKPAQPGAAVDASAQRPEPLAQGSPFTLGVASGDPDDHSVVLWTRLARDPLADDGGMGDRSYEVNWEIAEDAAMDRILQVGAVVCLADEGHSVHVEPSGLPSDSWLYYRFRCEGFTSPVGRARTMPAKGAPATRLSFALASCQSWEQGHYTAYEQMAKDDLDLVVFVGDYIYEYATGVQGKVRPHHGPECTNLAHYRTRYAQYRTDPLLQAMHARCPWVVTWDDHEVDNNYAGLVSAQKNVKPEDFAQRRRDAYRAYWENMPLRSSARPRGDGMRLHRRIDFDSLATLFVLDGRQHRSDQPNNDGAAPINAAALDPKQTMLGAEQMRWLREGLATSQATWNALAQQVMMAMVSTDPSKTGDKRPFHMDKWSGYAHERMEFVRFLRDQKVKNPIVLTGDVHANWCNEIRVDDRDVSTPVVAPEFVVTSISSGGDGEDAPKNLDKLLAANPCVRFHNLQRGYVRCTATPDEWTADFVVMDRVTQPGGKASVRASFVVKNGDPRVRAR